VSFIIVSSKRKQERLLTVFIINMFRILNIVFFFIDPKHLVREFLAYKHLVCEYLAYKYLAYKHLANKHLKQPRQQDNS
jgi:hypothetical protein